MAIGEEAAGSRSSENRDRSVLYRQTWGSAAFQEVARTNWVYNSLAYNPLDGYLYAISQGRYWNSSLRVYGDRNNQYQAGRLLRVSPIDGAVQDVGLVRGFQGTSTTGWPNDLYGGLSTGWIDSQGRYWVANATDSGTKDIYQVSIPAPGATNPTLTARRTTTDALANDHTSLNRAPEFAWGIRNGTTILERINVDTGQVTTFNLAGIATPLGETFQSGTYGTAWTLGNGNMAFGRNGSDYALQIAIANPYGATLADLGL